jgi:hypothetical protein
MIRYALGAGMAKRLVYIPAAVVVDHNQIRPPFFGGSYDLFPVFTGSYGVGYRFMNCSKAALNLSRASFRTSSEI